MDFTYALQHTTFKFITFCSSNYELLNYLTVFWGNQIRHRIGLKQIVVEVVQN
jgi:hypothetical protein